MNSISFWRLAWKEYRTQRSLWLSVLILTVLVQTCAAFVAALTAQGTIPGAVYVTMVFVAVGVYLLGCGATLFALEHEQGTFDFQRSLPVSRGRLYLAKVGTGVLGGLALFLLLLAVTHAVFAGWKGYLGPREWTAGWISVAEVFAWTVLYSLVLRHPLQAAVSGIITFVGVQVLLLTIFPTGEYEAGVYLYHRYFSTRVGILALLVAVNTWLAWRWFDGRIGWPNWLTRRQRQADLGWWVPTQLPAAPPGARQIGWRQLLSVSWRQGALVLVSLTGLMVWGLITALASTEPNRPTFAYAMGVWLMIGPATMFGLCAFSLDQWSHQYRFYSERGVDPRWLWCSRHAIWLPLVLILAVCVQLLASQLDGRDWLMQTAGWVLLSGTAYALAQLSGMLIRSTLVALVVSLFTTVLSAGWSLFTVDLGIPSWLSVLPMPVVGLATSWWFCKYWLEERTSVRRWVQLALALSLPAFVVLAGCACYRAYELPLVDPGVSVAEYTRPLTADEQSTLRLYEHADRIAAQNRHLMVSAASTQQQPLEKDTGAWLAASREAVDLLRQAHERPEVPVTLMSGYGGGVEGTGEFVGQAYPEASLQLLRFQAESHTRAGQVSEAWSCYEMEWELLRRIRLRPTEAVMRWASMEEIQLLESIARWGAHPRQSTDCITAAIARLAGLGPVGQDLARGVRVQYALWSRFLDGEPVEVRILGMRAEETALLQRMAWFMPWEATRCRRALNGFTRNSLSRIASNPSGRPNYWQRDRHSLLIPQIEMTLTHDPYSIATRRKATEILLAIVDWRREHGELPESLSVLVGPYFHELPIDPVTQSPFHYDPVGLSETIDIHVPTGSALLSVPMAGSPPIADPIDRLRRSMIWPIPDAVE